MMIRAFIQARRPGWKVTEAGNGQEALAALDGITPDFATVDINMPGMDGLELAGRLKLRCPGLAICMFSANIQESSRHQAENLRVGFVAKPITEASVDQAIAFFEALR